MSQIEINANVRSSSVAEALVHSSSTSSGSTLKTDTRKDLVPSSAQKLNQSVPQLVDQVNTHIRSLGTKIQFMVDSRTGKQVVIVSEKETGKIIRQIPPKEMLELAAKMKELVGIIYNGSA